MSLAKLLLSVAAKAAGFALFMVGFPAGILALGLIA